MFLQLLPVGCARHLPQLTHLMERTHFNKCSFTSLQISLGFLPCLQISHTAFTSKPWFGLKAAGPVGWQEWHSLGWKPFSHWEYTHKPFTNFWNRIWESEIGVWARCWQGTPVLSTLFYRGYTWVSGGKNMRFCSLFIAEQTFGK